MKRTRWVRRDVENPESIADHMYRMGLMALIASDIPGVDQDNSFVRMWRIARQKLRAGGFPVPVSSFNRNLNSAKFQSSIFGTVVPGKPSSLQLSNPLFPLCAVE
ncbi:HD domain-containing protein 2 [Camellia lanceoleosa]|uniref:HD domain-containing protein 2 n=1 Tax=Camellia lanceoleosa TaxID=1840588 RepID=A0ACC0HBD4_9ERIC|nr:HD domain-containing protein 2 [Camellia lanceoleosa]